MGLLYCYKCFPTNICDQIKQRMKSTRHYITLHWLKAGTSQDNLAEPISEYQTIPNYCSKNDGIVTVKKRTVKGVEFVPSSRQIIVTSILTVHVIAV